MIDALLGAAGLGDIGEHFPDTDERYRDADSLELLETVAHDRDRGGPRSRERRLHGGAGGAQARSPPAGDPRAPRPGAGLPATRVNVKATTGEGMGFVGRGEGVAALAVASLRTR